MMSRSFVLSMLARRRALGIKAPRAAMPRQVLPETIAIAYAEAIAPILEAARQEVAREVLPLAQRRLDGEFNRLLDGISERFFLRLSTSAIEAVSRRFAQRTSDWSRTEFSRQVKAGLGIDLPLSDPGLAKKIEAFVSENVAAIKSIPNQYLDDVEKFITQAVRQGKRYADVAEELTARYGVAQSRAKLLAREQVNQFYSDLNQARQQDLGLTQYIWRTSGDDRTRPEHAKRDGKIFSWDSPPSGGAPGQAIGCRCYAEPDLSPLLQGAA